MKPSVSKEQIRYDASAECRPSVSDKESIDISKPVDESTTDVLSFTTDVPSSATNDLIEQPNGGDIVGESINDKHKWKNPLRSRRKRCHGRRSP